MDLPKQLITSILEVTSFIKKTIPKDDFSVSNSKDHEGIADTAEQDMCLMSSIRRVSGLIIETGRADADRKENLTRLSMSSIAKIKSLDLLPATESVSILRRTANHRQENLHSNIISALLDLDTCGVFSILLLNEILSRISGRDWSNTVPSFQFSQREVLLVELDNTVKPTETDKRRIDILVQRPTEIVLFENKIDADESYNQTTDYAERINHRFKKNKTPFFIMLSPEGKKAKCNEFQSLSYLELYSCLKATHEKYRQEFPNQYEKNKLPQFYIEELASILPTFY